MSNWSGFWSYVHQDDHDEAGLIVSLASSLSARVRLLTGSEMQIFVDRVDLHWGDDWSVRLEEELLRTVFLIPVVTPSYFLSDWCRKELITFSSTATSLGLAELILPIYYVKTRQLEQYEEGNDDAVDLIHRFQWEDFTDSALEEVSSSSYRKSVDRIARELIRRAESADAKPSIVGAQTSPVPAGPTGPAEPPHPEDQTLQLNDNENGLIDTLATGETEITKMTEHTVKIGAVLERMGEVAMTATQATAASDAAEKGFVGRLVVLRQFASELNDCADEFAPTVRDYVASLILIDPSTRLLIRLMKDSDDKEAAATYVQSITDLAQSSSITTEQLLGLDKILTENAKLSKDLRAPTQRIHQSLQQMVDANSIFEEWLRLIQET